MIDGVFQLSRNMPGRVGMAREDEDHYAAVPDGRHNRVPPVRAGPHIPGGYPAMQALAFQGRAQQVGDPLVVIGVADKDVVTHGWATSPGPGAGIPSKALRMKRLDRGIGTHLVSGGARFV